MNETYFIKLQGKANIPSSLEIDKGYKVEAQCAVTNVLRSSNDNGEYDVTFVAKPYSIEIVKETGQRIKAADPRRNSQKIRNMLWKLYYDEGFTEDFDKIYDTATMVICSMMPSILREAIKRLEHET